MAKIFEIRFSCFHCCCTISCLVVSVFFQSTADPPLCRRCNSANAVPLLPAWPIGAPRSGIFSSPRPCSRFTLSSRTQPHATSYVSVMRDPLVVVSLKHTGCEFRVPRTSPSRLRVLPTFVTSETNFPVSHLNDSNVYIVIINYEAYISCT